MTLILRTTADTVLYQGVVRLITHADRAIIVGADRAYVERNPILSLEVRP